MLNHDHLAVLNDRISTLSSTQKSPPLFLVDTWLVVSKGKIDFLMVREPFARSLATLVYDYLAVFFHCF